MTQFYIVFFAYIAWPNFRKLHRNDPWVILFDYKGYAWLEISGKQPTVFMSNLSVYMCIVRTQLLW